MSSERQQLQHSPAWELARLLWKNQIMAQSPSFFYPDDRPQHLGTLAEIKEMVRKLLSDEGIAHIPLLSRDEIPILLGHITTERVKIAHTVHTIQELQTKETVSQAYKETLRKQIHQLTTPMIDLEDLQYRLNKALPTAVLSLSQHPMHVWIMHADRDEAVISRKIHALDLLGKKNMCKFVLDAILVLSMVYRVEYMQVMSILLPKVIQTTKERIHFPVSPDGAAEKKPVGSPAEILARVLSQQEPIETWPSKYSTRSLHLLMDSMMRHIHGNPSALTTLPKGCYRIIFSMLSSEVCSHEVYPQNLYNGHQFTTWYIPVWLSMLQVCAYVNTRDAIHYEHEIEHTSRYMSDNNVPVPKSVETERPFAKTQVILQMNEVPEKYWLDMLAWCGEPQSHASAAASGPSHSSSARGAAYGNYARHTGLL
jgi:hypothetical protein